MLVLLMFKHLLAQEASVHTLQLEGLSWRPSSATHYRCVLEQVTSTAWCFGFLIYKVELKLPFS